MRFPNNIKIDFENRKVEIEGEDLRPETIKYFLYELSFISFIGAHLNYPKTQIKDSVEAVK